MTEISNVCIRAILMDRLVYPDAQLQITGCAHFGPETLPEVPGGLYGKNKSIGNISGSNLIDDVSFIIEWNVTLSQ